jgi:hypothetical protein
MKVVMLSLAALTIAAVVAAPVSGHTAGSTIRLATCSDYSYQGDAQRAMDTRDADGDRIYCESLPCPYLKPGDTGGGGGGGSPIPAPKPTASCTRPSGVLRLVFSRSKYPHIRRHFIAAVKRGWPRVMVLNRKGADERRDRLLKGVPIRSGFDRDEYVSEGAGPTAISAALCAGSTRLAGWRTWRTSRVARTARTAHRSARSSARSATARASSAPSPECRLARSAA